MKPLKKNYRNSRISVGSMSGGEVNTLMFFSLQTIKRLLENAIMDPQSTLDYTTSPLYVISGTFSGERIIVVIDPETI